MGAMNLCAIGVAGGQADEIRRQRVTVHHSIANDFLEEPKAVSGVDFVKENEELGLLVLRCEVNGSLHELEDLFLSRAAMNIWKENERRRPEQRRADL